MTQEEVEAETKHIIQKTPRNPLFIKERLRKKLQEKKQKEDESKLSKQTVQQSLGVEVKETVETKNQLDSNIKKLTELLEKSKE